MARLYGEPGSRLARRYKAGLAATILLTAAFSIPILFFAWRSISHAMEMPFSEADMALSAFYMLVSIIIILGFGLFLLAALVLPSYKGYVGERRVAEELSGLPKDYAVFFNVPLGGLDADAVVVGPVGVYVVEVKNWENCVLQPLKSGAWLRVPKGPWGYGKAYEVTPPTRQAKAAAARIRGIVGRWVDAVVALPPSAEFPLKKWEGVAVLSFGEIARHIHTVLVPQLADA